jgi:hypothetical protein
MLLVLVAGPAGAGEIVLRSGERLPGELLDQPLLLSTGSEIVEIASADVAVVTPGEVQLVDGRRLRGTLVGSRLRTRTSYGELAIRLDDLVEFRVAPERPKAAAAAASVTPAPATTAPASTPSATPPPASPSPGIPVPIVASPGPSPASPPASASPGIPLPVVASPGPSPASPPAAASGAPATPPSSGPTQVAAGGQQVGDGVGQMATGVGRTVENGADRLGDGFKALGLAIWEGMKSLGRAVEQAFTGSD